MHFDGILSLIKKTPVNIPNAFDSVFLPKEQHFGDLGVLSTWFSNWAMESRISIKARNTINSRQTR